MKQTKSKNYGIWAFLPLLTFLMLYLGSGIVFTILGAERPFGHVPVLSTLIVGILIAFAMNRQRTLDEKIDIFTTSIHESGVFLMILIFVFSGAFSAVSKAMGGVDSVVNLGLHFMPPNFLVLGIFIISAFISTSTGTCFGTVVTMIPIAQGIVATTTINPALAMAAMFGGCLFGDDLSPISDTTIATTRGIGVEIRAKTIVNAKIAAPALLMAVIAFGIAGIGSESVIESAEYSIIKVVPYLSVLISAVAGVHVLVVLTIGIVLSAAVGFLTASLTLTELMQAISQGVLNMAEASFVAIFVCGLIGIAKANGGLDWLIGTLSKNIRTSKGAELATALLAFVLSFALLDSTVSTITAAPIAKQIGERYHIDLKCLCNTVQIFAIIGVCVAPHSSMMTLMSSSVGVSPLSVLKFSFYQYFLAASALLTIFLKLYHVKEKRETEK